jgi:hypothetical protein
MFGMWMLAVLNAPAYPMLCIDFGHSTHGPGTPDWPQSRSQEPEYNPRVTHSSIISDKSAAHSAPGSACWSVLLASRGISVTGIPNFHTFHTKRLTGPNIFCLLSPRYYVFGNAFGKYQIASLRASAYNRPPHRRASLPDWLCSSQKTIDAPTRPQSPAPSPKGGCSRRTDGVY